MTADSVYPSNYALSSNDLPAKRLRMTQKENTFFPSLPLSSSFDGNYESYHHDARAGSDKSYTYSKYTTTCHFFSFLLYFVVAAFGCVISEEHVNMLPKNAVIVLSCSNWKYSLHIAMSSTNACV